MLSVEAVHHVDLCEVGVVHDFPLSSEVAQGLLLIEDGDDFSQELGDGDGPDLFVLNGERGTSMVCWMELVMISSLMGSSLISFSSCSFVHRPWNPKQ